MTMKTATDSLNTFYRIVRYRKATDGSKRIVREYLMHPSEWDRSREWSSLSVNAWNIGAGVMYARLPGEKLVKVTTIIRVKKKRL